MGPMGPMGANGIAVAGGPLGAVAKSIGLGKVPQGKPKESERSEPWVLPKNVAAKR